jgi:mono/diheme cytochrome c family protein
MNTLRAVMGLMLLAMAPAAFGAAPDGGDAEHGRRLFYQHGCYGCHGYGGQTGARDLVGTGSALIADEATFRLFLRLRGEQAPEVPAMTMPNFPATALSDADVHDLYAFLRSLKLDAPRIEDVPTLRRILELASRAPSVSAASPASPAPGTAPAPAAPRR